MDQNNVRLNDEMTKLITSMLSKRKGLYLPSIGSLSLTAEGITLSAEKSHRSILVEIAERGKCSKGQAESLYNKWLEEVRVKNVVKIEGIGTIKEGAFTIDPALSERLNAEPKRVEPKRVEPKKSEPKTEPSTPNPKKSAITWGIVAFVLVLCIGAILVTTMESGEETAAVEETIAEVIETEEVTEEEVTEEMAIVPTPGPIKLDRNKLKSKARYITATKAIEIFEEEMSREAEDAAQYRVVCGVLSTKTNAGRLLLDTKLRTEGIEGATPHIYPRDEGYMVTLFEGSSFGECVGFIKGEAAALYDNCWVYNEKTMKL